MNDPNEGMPQGCPYKMKPPSEAITGGVNSETNDSGKVTSGDAKPSPAGAEAIEPGGEANTNGNSAGPEGSRGYWAPQSPLVGVGALEYTFWGMLHFWLQKLNHLCAKPHIRVSFYNWPLPFGLLYLLAKLHYVRFRSITSSYDYKTTLQYPLVREPRRNGPWISTDGSYNADPVIRDMGGPETRFGWNSPPDKPLNVDQITPSLIEQTRLLYRRVDADGEDIEVLADKRNVLFGDWILTMVHAFFLDDSRCPVTQSPLSIPRDPLVGGSSGPMVVDRIKPDPTRVTENGIPTALAKFHQWLMDNVYGPTKEKQDRLRTSEHGKLKLTSEGDLLEDDQAPGLPLVGAANNMTPGQYILLMTFMRDHNACCDWLLESDPDMDDETLFQSARLAMAGKIVRIHTLPWTMELIRHDITKAAMKADWAGLIGERRKFYLMRLFDRHPLLNQLGSILRNFQPLWGMPGSRHRHFAGEYQVTAEFRVAYRLHWLLRSNFQLFDPKTRELVGRFKLLDCIGFNTRPFIQEHGADAALFSIVMHECGAPVLHGLPNSLRKLMNQQTGEEIDLGMIDLLREYMSGNWSYLRYMKALGEKPPTTFAELTGGDLELATALEQLYQGNLELIPVQVGLLVEYKAPGNALSSTQFFEFALAAPRRFLSLWQFTTGFTIKDWGKLMDWSFHSDGLMGMFWRHFPKLRDQMEGVEHPFNLWPDPDKFPQVLFERVEACTDELAEASFTSFVMGAAIGVASIWTGAVSTSVVVSLLVTYTFVSLVMSGKRRMIMLDLEKCVKRWKTDMRPHMFGTLKDANDWINRASFFGKLSALALIAGSGFMVWETFASHPLIALLFGLLAVSGFSIRKKSDALVECAHLLKIVLRKRMRKPLQYIGMPPVDEQVAAPLTANAHTADYPDIVNRYMYLAEEGDSLVANFSSCYRALTTQDQLPPWTAFVTTVMSLVLFGRKSQKGLTLNAKRRLGLDGFGSSLKIYVPGLVHLIDEESNTQVYAAAGNSDGVRPGDVNIKQLDRIFRQFAPGLSRLTEYDCARLREWCNVRDAKAKRGNFFSRLFGQLKLKRRHDQLFEVYADTTAADEAAGTTVQAISYEQLLAVYKGTARQQLVRELREGSENPRPVAYTSLEALASASPQKLEELYANGEVTAVPVGETIGKAIILPGTTLGGILSSIANLIWSGKVFARAEAKVAGQNSVLVNKILGMQMVKAEVFESVSWSDRKQALVIDYRGTSWLAFFIRDEIRLVEDDLYLGKVYIRLPFGRAMPVLYFALDLRIE